LPLVLLILLRGAKIGFLYCYPKLFLVFFCLFFELSLICCLSVGLFGLITDRKRFFSCGTLVFDTDCGIRGFLILGKMRPAPLSEGEGEGWCEVIVFIGLCIGAVNNFLFL
jgi:hypothetical protein